MHCFGNGVGGGGGERADKSGLECAQDGSVAGEAALDVAEEEEGCEGDADGGEHRLPRGRDEHVGQEGDQAANYVGQGDRQRTLECPPRVRLL